MKYKLIFFDADETLFDYKKNERYAFVETLRKSIDIADSDINIIYHTYQEINNIFWTQYHKGEITKETILDNRFKLLFNKFKLSIDPKMFGEMYLHNLSIQKFLLPNVLETIKKLSKHCKLVIITNGVSNVHKKRFRQSELRFYISDIIISGDFTKKINFQKPFPQIFEYAHNRIAPNIPIEKILMVGDSLTSDIKGGNNYGIDTCWFNPSDVPKRENIVPTYIINDFSQLLKIINDSN